MPIGVYPRFLAPLEERFWARVEKTDGCWFWRGGKLVSGYGLFTGERHDRRLAHRVAYELTNGPIAEGLFVLHSCDTPTCVNPAHLRTGTYADNAADMVARGRHRFHKSPVCPNRHEYTPENTKTRPGGGRMCVTCDRDRKRRHLNRQVVAQ